MKEYNKILIYQYGKVGSTSLEKSIKNSKYYNNIVENYNTFGIKTHNHMVAKDVLKKYKNILIIIGIRLPINRNISCFWEISKRDFQNCINSTIENILIKYKEKFNNNNTDKFLTESFELLDININDIQFDFNNKYYVTSKNSNDILIYRFEDFEYLIKNVFPKYDIIIKKDHYPSYKKDYFNKYLLHKRKYKVDEIEKKRIRNSIYLNKFYTKEEIENHINEYS
uniref:Uncharacterized protein n=1 Tax=Mimiviridae sp. ChoanoV1 TaxID=2596887 RepID=A0A5B8HYE0_9VIRU|nr:hypothetical protein 6_2 [Mimiviridae sp. ChoanoV1]